jgi:hypothetical protein
MRHLSGLFASVLVACSGAVSERGPTTEPPPPPSPSASAEPANPRAPSEPSDDPADEGIDPGAARRAGIATARSSGVAGLLGELEAGIVVDTDCRRVGCPAGLELQCVAEDRPSIHGRPAVARRLVSETALGTAGVGGAAETPPPATHGLLGHGGGSR